MLISEEKTTDPTAPANVNETKSEENFAAKPQICNITSYGLYMDANCTQETNSFNLAPRFNEILESGQCE